MGIPGIIAQNICCDLKAVLLKYLPKFLDMKETAKN